MTYKKINKILFICILAYIPLSLTYPILMYAYRDNQRLIVMDTNNTYHLSSYTSKEQKKKLYKSLARYAVNAFLSRNPNGLDHPLLFDDIYFKSARIGAIKQIESEEKKFKDNQIHQKVEILGTKVLPSSNNTSYVNVKGQLIRFYLYDDEEASYTLTFEASLTLQRNKNLATNFQYPYVVVKLKYKQQIIND